MPGAVREEVAVDALLKLDSISKAFSGVQALNSVSFELRAGEVHALVGENGAGKSTLIKVITGAHQPDSGRIALDGQAIRHRDPGAARMLGIAAIYQQPALFAELTVAENIAMGSEGGGVWRKVRWEERRQRARELLDRVGAGLSVDSYVRELSMPEQQLVEIARALGAHAKVLIMDEPTASLSGREVEHLFDVIRELRAGGVGIIYISHRLEELFEIADRVTVLRDGRWVATEPMGGVSRADLIRMMVGRELATVFPKAEVELGQVMLDVKGLCCEAAGVNDVSFQVRRGEILGLAGLVGSGRTELARVLFGLEPADGGEIWLDGRRLVVDSPGQAVASGIAYVPEDRRRHGVILEMSVGQNMTLAILRKIGTAGWVWFHRENRIAEELVARLGVKTPSVDSLVGNLSGGNQQKVALGRWLATDPCVLILDEPTQGVDVGAKAEIHRLMGELARKGMAIVMISSELPEVLGMSDRVAVMHGGRIVRFLARSEASQQKVLELAFGEVCEGGKA